MAADQSIEKKAMGVEKRDADQMLVMKWPALIIKNFLVVIPPKSSLNIIEFACFITMQ